MIFNNMCDLSNMDKLLHAGLFKSEVICLLKTHTTSLSQFN